MTMQNQKILDRSPMLPSSNLTHVADGDLPLNAQNPPGSGFTFNGAGQSAHNYNHQTNLGDGIDVGLQINHFAGPNYTPISVSSDGTVNYAVQHGVSPNNANRAEWSFNYSVDQINNEALQGHNFNLKLSFDGRTALDLHSVVLEGKQFPGPAHVVWENSNGNVIIGDDGHNPDSPIHVTQNSENIAFFLNQINATIPKQSQEQPYHFEAGHTFDITLSEVTPTGMPINTVQDHIVVV